MSPPWRPCTQSTTSTISSGFDSRVPGICRQAASAAQQLYIPSNVEQQLFRENRRASSVSQAITTFIDVCTGHDAGLQSTNPLSTFKSIDMAIDDESDHDHHSAVGGHGSSSVTGGRVAHRGRAECRIALRCPKTIHSLFAAPDSARVPLHHFRKATGQSKAERLSGHF